MSKRTGIMIGFLAASLIPALQFAVFALASDSNAHSAGPWEGIGFGAASLLVFYPYSAFFTALFGVPAFYLANRLRLATWWFAILTGAFFGVLLSAIFRSAKNPYVYDFLRYVPVSAISALVFWLFWHRASSRTHD
jgi:hypothetical protein